MDERTKNKRISDFIRVSRMKLSQALYFFTGTSMLETSKLDIKMLK